jgi:hypothetical protein
MRVLCIALIALMASGCFVSDELDKGIAIIDQHGNKGKGKKATAQEEAPPEPAEAPAPRGHRKEPGLWDSLVGWVEEELEPEPPPPDPEDAPVRCWIGKREHFSSLRDCQARGGKPVSLDPVQ